MSDELERKDRILGVEMAAKLDALKEVEKLKGWVESNEAEATRLGQMVEQMRIREQRLRGFLADWGICPDCGETTGGKNGQHKQGYPCPAASNEVKATVEGDTVIVDISIPFTPEQKIIVDAHIAAYKKWLNEYYSEKYEERAELRSLEEEFERSGGRGVELAERIDELRRSLGVNDGS